MSCLNGWTAWNRVVVNYGRTPKSGSNKKTKHEDGKGDIAKAMTK